MRRVIFRLTVLFATAFGATLPHAWLQAREQSLPPVTYVCPMAEHADVLEDKPGKCPRCEMVLVPVIIDLAWSCPVHPVVITDRAGRCPLDKRDLVQVAISRYWTCRDTPQQRLLSPGRCADGSARTMVREHRAHGDHNPKRGGQLFMASDKWHHIEATYPRAGVLRVYVYDNFTQPMPVSEFSGRAVTREEFDTASGKSREIEAFPLKRSRDGTSFDASVGSRPLPARVTVKLKFRPGAPDERFDFTFEALSIEPASSPALTRQQPATPSVGANAAGGRAPARPVARQDSAPPAPASGTAPPATADAGAQSANRPGMNAVLVPFDPTQLLDPLPSDPGELLKLLTLRDQEVTKLLEDGQLAAVYVPAIQAKDIALALEEHARGLADRRRLEAVAAIRMVVLKAWELDAYGDLGDAHKLAHAHAGFAAAIKDLQSAYASR